MKKKFLVLIIALCGVLAVFVTACENESGNQTRKCKCWYSYPDIDKYAGIYEVAANESCSSLNVPGIYTTYSFYCKNA